MFPPGGAVTTVKVLGSFFSHHLLLYKTLAQWEMSGKTDMSTKSNVTMIQGEGKQSSSFIQR